MLQQQETEPGNKRNLIAVINERVRCTYVSIWFYYSLYFTQCVYTLRAQLCATVLFIYAC